MGSPSRQTLWPFPVLPARRTKDSRPGGDSRRYVLAANHLVDVVLARENEKGRLNDTAAETQHEVKGGLLLDVVVREGAAVLELLAREDETLLVRGDACERREKGIIT